CAGHYNFTRFSGATDVCGYFNGGTASLTGAGMRALSQGNTRPSRQAPSLDTANQRCGAAHRALGAIEGCEHASMVYERPATEPTQLVFNFRSDLSHIRCQDRCQDPVMLFYGPHTGDESLDFRQDGFLVADEREVIGARKLDEARIRNR